MINLIIADPDHAARKALSLLLRRKLEVQHIVEAEDVETLICALAETSPDLLLLDWKLYGSPAPETCLLLQKAYPRLKIILLSVNADDEAVAKNAGANFIHKGASPDEMIAMLKSFISNKSSTHHDAPSEPQKILLEQSQQIDQKHEGKKVSQQLTLFILLTFIWTWAFYVPIVTGGHDPYQMPWMILLIFGGMGPSVIGIAMVLLTLDKESRHDYWKRCFSLNRISGLWWTIIFFLFPLFYSLGILIDVMLGASLPEMTQLKSLLAAPWMFPLAAFISFMSGPWSEEFGWRGYALDRIMTPFGLLAGTVVLGLVWGIWHLPLFYMPATWHGQIGLGLSGFGMFMLRSVGLALLMTWVYLNTGRSILSGMLMHFTSNFTGQLLAAVSTRVEILESLFVFLVGLFACSWMLRKKQIR